ncbi:MAG TPA: hypothetical protein VFA63_05185, partial [Pseudonocardiaceae bacterium]|nr:hypothetical protein [Pseudonocardiaceae bacterium]
KRRACGSVRGINRKSPGSDYPALMARSIFVAGRCIIPQGHAYTMHRMPTGVLQNGRPQKGNGASFVQSTYPRIQLATVVEVLTLVNI